MYMKIKRILAPTDFSPPSLAAVDEPVDFARKFGSEVVLLFVHEPPYVGLDPDPYAASAEFRLLFAERRRVAQEQMSALNRKIAKRRAKCRAMFGDGQPAATIVATARRLRVDLIVMATHGRAGAKRWLLGSVAEKVVRATECPVLTLRIPPRHASRSSARQKAAR